MQRRTIGLSVLDLTPNGAGQDATEQFSPRDIDGTPRCCGESMACTDAHLTECGTQESRWYCVTCKRVTNTEDRITIRTPSVEHTREWDAATDDEDYEERDHAA